MGAATSNSSLPNFSCAAYHGFLFQSFCITLVAQCEHEAVPGFPGSNFDILFTESTALLNSIFSHGSASGLPASAFLPSGLFPLLGFPSFSGLSLTTLPLITFLLPGCGFSGGMIFVSVSSTSFSSPSFRYAFSSKEVKNPLICPFRFRPLPRRATFHNIPCRRCTWPVMFFQRAESYFFLLRLT